MHSLIQSIHLLEKPNLNGNERATLQKKRGSKKSVPLGSFLFPSFSLRKGVSLNAMETRASLTGESL